MRQPWANLIVYGVKPLENRQWYCSYRGRLVIHAGRTWGAEEEKNYEQLMQIAVDHDDKPRQEALFMARSMLGGFVGMVDMVGCIDDGVWRRRGGGAFDGWQNWFVGPYAFEFARARAFNRLVTYKGRQGMFRVPAWALAEFEEAET